MHLPKVDKNGIPYLSYSQISSFIKNKKECTPFKSQESVNFSNDVLTNEFIDDINKHYVLISLICAISFDETYNFIIKNKEKYK